MKAKSLKTENEIKSVCKCVIPKVGIVIVNYNGFEYSKDCIDSLGHVGYRNFLTIFVDNGSTDGSGDMIRSLYKDTIQIVSLPVNLGVTGGNNAGIDYALKNGCDYVLFLNNDTIVEPYFLARIIETSLINGVTLVVPKIVCHLDPSRLDHWIGEEYDWWIGRPKGHRTYPLDQPQLNIRSEIKVASTCCLLVPIKVIQSIGGMDENYFMYFDDADFTIRAVNAGYRIMYEPEAIIYHKCNMTTSNKQPSFFEYYLINRNIFYFYRKLCGHYVPKIYFLSQSITRMLYHYIKAYVWNDPRLRKVIKITFKDILNKRMGVLPKAFYEGN